MTGAIDHKQPEEFNRLCTEHHIEFPSTVHHFEMQENGRYKAVLWNEITLEKTDVRE